MLTTSGYTIALSIMKSKGHNLFAPIFVIDFHDPDQGFYFVS